MPQLGSPGLPDVFIDEIELATITTATWETADNYTPTSNGIDDLELDINRLTN